MIIYNHITPPVSELELEMLKSIPPGGNWKHIPDTVKSQRIAQIRKSGGRTTYYGRLQWNKPSYTISTYFNRIGNGCHIHPSQDRLISTREAARLQSFRDSFIFYGSKTSQYKQVGNAVPPLLARAIAENIKPYVKNRSFIDLFAGAGGLSAGFLLEKYKLVGAIEVERHFFETFSKNHASPEAELILGDITSDGYKEMLIKKGKEDGAGLVIGGPPCQGFSTAGWRNPEDKRNKLFRDFLDIVQGVKPEVFIIENVPGILSMEHGNVIRTIKSAFEHIGYHVNQPAKLKAEEYGVPQLRRRVILVGSIDKVEIGLPSPLFSDTNPELPKPITVADAIKGLPPLGINEGSFEMEANIKPTSKYEEFIMGKIAFPEFYGAMKQSIS